MNDLLNKKDENVKKFNDTLVTESKNRFAIRIYQMIYR
jgi:hypothetical protein